MKKSISRKVADSEADISHILCLTVKVYNCNNSSTQLTFAIVCLIKLAVVFNESSSMSILCCFGSLGPNKGGFVSGIPIKFVLSSVFLFLFSKLAVLGINLGAVNRGTGCFIVLSLSFLSADAEFGLFEVWLERSGEAGMKWCRDPILSSVGALVCGLCDLNSLKDKHC